MGSSRRILIFAVTALSIFAFVKVSPLQSADIWDDPVTALSEKITALVERRAAITLEMRNLSSLTESEVVLITRELRQQLTRRGIRMVKTVRPISQVIVTLSENLQGYVWIAEIRRGGSQEYAVFAFPQPQHATLPEQANTLVLQKTEVYAQAIPILDFEMAETPTDMPPMCLVLDTEKLSLHRKRPGGWDLVLARPILRVQPWPRDPRGHIVLHAAGSFDVYVPGTKCRGAITPMFSLECAPSEESWPLGTDGAGEMGAHLTPNRNFFDGRLTSASGGNSQVPPFFAAAVISGGDAPVRIFTGVDERARIYSTGPEPVATLEGWGSDVAALENDCGNGRQVLVTQSGDSMDADAVRAYTMSGNKPVESATPVLFSGPVTALWAGGDGRAARAISHNFKTGNYEAFTLSISCGR